MSPSIVVDRQHLDAMGAHARFCLPNEACGLVAVDDAGAMAMVYCLSNLDISPYRFTVDPAEHYGAWRHAAALGLEIAGSFHSHPESNAVPSTTDIAGALDPTWVYFIVGSVRSAGFDVRAYRIRDGSAEEVELVTRHSSVPQ
jgi:proteasome lid subunit RPN8/RPN11